MRSRLYAYKQKLMLDKTKVKSLTHQTDKIPSNGETVFSLGTTAGSTDGFFSTAKITNFNVL